jgi:V8-like Glu-specific endopeptidase
MKMSVLIIALFFSFGTFAKNKIIYGDDNRLESFEVDSEWQSLASAVAGAFTSRDIKKDDEYTYTITPSGTLGSGGVCSDQKFVKQPTAAFCSGFLISEDTLITAGHCVESFFGLGDICDQTTWVFDYKMENAGSIDLKVDSSNVYSCKSIVKYLVEDHTSGTGTDYAVVKLDRKVTGRKVLKVRTKGSVVAGDKLVVMGHPSGLPMKISGGAKVQINTSKAYFEANLDTFGGNSGSPVVNAVTKEVEGILVRGKVDYVRRSGENNSSCEAVNVCGDDGKNCSVDDSLKFEHVTRISEIF